MNTRRSPVNPIAAGITAVGLALTANSALAEPKSYKIDEEHLSITFETNHLAMPR